MKNNSSRIKQAMAAAIATTSVISTASAANVLLNPGFETATSQANGNNLTAETGLVSYAGSNYGTVTSSGVNNWTQSGGSRIWYAKERNSDVGNAFPGDPGNTYAIRLDGNPAEGDNFLQYATTITLNAGDIVDFSLSAWRETGNNTLFATLTDGPTTIDLLGNAGTLVNGINTYSSAAPLVVATSGSYTLTVNAAQNGNNHLYVDDLNLDVTPVPEPSSTALLGLGALGLILRRKR